jgi:hypothetical protein
VGITKFRAHINYPLDVDFAKGSDQERTAARHLKRCLWTKREVINNSRYHQLRHHKDRLACLGDLCANGVEQHAGVCVEGVRAGQ